MRKFQITLADRSIKVIEATVAVVDPGNSDLILYAYEDDRDRVVARFNKRFWMWYKEVPENENER